MHLGRTCKAQHKGAGHEGLEGIEGLSPLPVALFLAGQFTQGRNPPDALALLHWALDTQEG